jgi:hypothetical protein
MQYEPVVVYDNPDTASPEEAVAVPAYASKWWPSYDRKFLLVFGCILVFGIVFFALWWAATVQMNNEMHTHSLDIAQLRERANPFDSHAFYSQVALRKDEYRATHCHWGIYRQVNTDDGLSILEPLATDRLDELATAKPCVMEAQVPMRFNVPPQSLPASYSSLSSSTPKNQDQRYIIVRVELATNYQSFSTIRLVESAVDIYRRVVKTTRYLTLCSDDPVSSVGRCRRHLTVDGTMVMNDTFVMTMDQPQVTPAPTPAVKRNSTATSGIPPRGQSRDATPDNAVSLNNKDDRSVLEQNIAHIRLYHLLFYSEYRDGTPEDDSPTNNDYLALSAQLKPC